MPLDILNAGRNFDALEEKIGYSFADKNLLLMALSHPSVKQSYKVKNYISTQKYDFEKLELLGDSVLSLAMTHILMELYPSYPHGKISQIKNYLVSKKVLALVAKQVELGSFLRIAEGEELLGGRTNINNLENTLESLLGSVYLDSENFSAVIICVQNLWHDELCAAQDLAQIDPKSSLQTKAHSMQLGTPTYKILERSGPEHTPKFVVSVTLRNGLEGQGTGKSKKEAEINAAASLLQKLMQ